jgi:predicted LPLAT superfamily acyltransferase
MTAADTQEWLARKERGAVPVMKLFVWMALQLGRPLTRLFLAPLCLYFVLFCGEARRASIDYLQRVLSRTPRFGDIFRHFHTFGSVVLDRIYLLNDQLDLFDIRITGEEIVQDIAGAGQGCLLLGAHLGSFEVLRAVGRRQPDLQVSIVMYEDNARKTNAALNAINPNLAMEVIALGRSGSLLQVEARLSTGHFVGVLADRGLACEDQVRIDFLGDPAAFPEGPFRMGALFKRPMVLMFGLYRGGNRYDVHFERFDPAPETALTEYAARLAHYAKIAPFNWFNFYEFWR